MCALYDIPANITDRFPLEKSPVVTAVFAVLDMLLYGFRRADVNRALQSPYVRFMRKERGRRKVAPVDAANLFTVAGRLRITGGKRFGRDGKSQWLRRMESRLGYLSKREILLNNSPNADADELTETRRFIDEIELAKRDFIALTNLFPRENAEFAPTEFAEFIKADILAKLQVHEQIINFHDHARTLASEAADKQDSSTKRMTEFLGLEEEVEKDARALAAFIELLDELTAILSERDRRFMEAAKAHKRELSEKYTKNGKLRSIEEYAERLRTAVRNGRYQVREKLGYGVTITSLEQIRGVPFRLTIMCGAVDGEFPMSYVPETFLGKELLDSEDRFLRRERIQFYQALMNTPLKIEDATKRVFITYPERNEKGDEFTRSPFVDALLKITSLNAVGKVYRNGVSTGMEKSSSGNTLAVPELTFLRALASEEETVRSLAIAYTRAESDEERRLVTEEYKNALTSDHAKEALKRVTAYLDAKRNMDASLSHVRVEAAHLGKSVYSISALEQYAKCPYQFFASKSLHLREVQQFETSLSPMESGSLLHTILYKFYQELREEIRSTSKDSSDVQIIKPMREGLPDIIPVRLQPERSEEYRRTLHRIAEEEIAAIRFEHPFFELDRESLVGTNAEEPLEYRRTGKLDVWLDAELERVAGGWAFVPSLAEFAFGELKSVLGNVELGEQLRLHGKIDRIELGFDEDGTPHEFLIGDYKSGSSVASNTDIRKGISLQMPLYAAATEELLRSAYGLDAEAAGAVYYILSPKSAAEDKEAKTHSFVMTPQDSPLAGKRKGASEFVENRADMRDMIDSTVQRAAEYAESVSKGYFNVEPYSARHCEFCSFRAVCRIGEVQSGQE
jgi:ATP-dependent helicase/nuclease subunit B